MYIDITVATSPRKEVNWPKNCRPFTYQLWRQAWLHAHIKILKQQIVL